MYIMWIATAMIKKKDRNEYDKEENGVIKSKKAWKKDAYINFGIFVGCLLFIIFFMCYNYFVIINFERFL